MIQSIACKKLLLFCNHNFLLVMHLSCFIMDLPFFHELEVEIEEFISLTFSKVKKSTTNHILFFEFILRLKLTKGGHLD